jgi:transposase
LPILGRQTYICLRPKRYECPNCHGKPTTTQQLDWYTPRSSSTRAYEQQLLLSLVNSTIHDVSIKEAIGYEAIMGVLDRQMDRAINWEDFTRLDVIGIDEISLRKGHRNFVAIITARVESETLILGVLPDRKKATVVAFLRGMPKRLRQTIHSVCSDMYDGFVNAAKEVLGRHVKVVIDRFHVAKLYRSGLDGLRKQELHRLKHELCEADYDQLKGAMWALRKSEDDMTDKDQDVLVCLFEHSPLLQTAYNLCGELTSIFDMHMSKRKGKSQLRKWMRKVRASALSCFDGFVTTLETHLDDIANYFINRHTSGFVEGFNNKLKVIKRRCYGISNVTHLFQRIQLDLYGYSLRALKS